MPEAFSENGYRVSAVPGVERAVAQFGLVLEPHGAVGWAGLMKYFEGFPEEAGVLAVSLETAHPAKFPEEIRACIGLDPDPPPSLAGLDQREESYRTIPADYDAFRRILSNQFKQ